MTFLRIVSWRGDSRHPIDYLIFTILEIATLAQRIFVPGSAS